MIASNNERVSAVVENYVLSRDIGKGWARQIEHRFEQLTAWLGSDPPFSQLDCLTVNRWLKELQEQAICGRAITSPSYRTTAQVFHF